jgi:hypothetical protein
MSFVNSLRLDFRPSLPKVGTGKGLSEFCTTLLDKGFDSDTLLDVKDALDGVKETASAPVLRALVSTVTTEGGRNAAAIQENLRGIEELGKQLESCFNANYPLTGNAILRQRGGFLIKKLLELSHADSAAFRARADGLTVLKKELDFWSRAELQLLDAGMSMEDIVAAREHFLADMFVVGEKESHLKQIAYKCIATEESLYHAWDPAIDTLDKLLLDYKSEKGALTEADIECMKNLGMVNTATVKNLNRSENVNFPSDEEIQSLRTDVQARVQAEGLGTGAATFGTKDYETRTERIDKAFRDDWLAKWKTDEKDNALQKLEGWPEDLIDELRELDLMATVPEKKTEYINDARQDGKTFNNVWAIDSALEVANNPQGKIETTRFTRGDVIDVKLGKADAERAKDWTSRYLGKAIEEMDKRVIAKLVNLHNDDNSADQNTDSLHDLKHELDFWAAAETRLLEEGMTKEDARATRENYLTEMATHLEKAEHLTEVIERCFHDTTNVEAVLSHDQEPVIALIEKYMEKNENAAHFPDVTHFTKLLDAFVKEIRAAHAEITGQSSPQNQTMTPEEINEIVKKTAKEQLKERFMEPWIANNPAKKHLEDWPIGLAEQVEAMGNLTPVSAERKTKYLEALANSKR